LSYPAPLEAHEEIVRPEWIDGNGHMNLAYYVVIFDHATDTFCDLVELGDAYRAATNNGIFAVETHTLYARELTQGERVRVRTHLLGADAKRFHLAHEMIHAGSGERAAMQEILFLHVDLGTRRVAPFPPDLALRMQAAHAAHAMLPPPDWVGRRISLPQAASGGAGAATRGATRP
jgi:acyl-CoA thioester hydrolase